MLEYFSEIGPIKTTFILILTFIVIFIVSTVKNWLLSRTYFNKLNIPGPKPLPLVGNFHEAIKKGLVANDLGLINTYGRTLGFFEGAAPVVLTTDVQLIKRVMIKDFSYFVNRRIFDATNFYPFDKFLTTLKDEDWKNARSLVTKTFTSGKLKAMSKCVLECTKNFEIYLDNLVENGDGILDTSKKFGSYTADVITSCGFGVDANSINDENSIMDKHLNDVFDFNIVKEPKFILLFLLPKLAGYLASRKIIHFFPPEPIAYFSDLTDKVIERRKKKLEKRDDFIQFMVEHEENLEDKTTSNEKSEVITDENGLPWTSLKKTVTNGEILANSILFLMAGKETTATTLTFIAYNLALYPKYQDELIKEIDEILEKHNGELSYDAVNHAPYTDMVIDETLRMYPSALRLDRTASKDYEYNGMKFPKGTILTVSIWALHHDPEIYPDPYDFKPERFNDANKKQRETEAFLPFGAGPRICVGMRLALLEIKFLLFSVLSKYRFEKCEKTIETIEIDNSGFARSSKPIFVKVVRR